MTYVERVQAQIAKRETDFIPVAGLGYSSEVRKKINHLLGDDSWHAVVQSCNHIYDIGRDQNVLIDWWDTEQHEARFRDPFGSVWRVDGHAYHLETPAIPNADLSRYRFPGTSTFFADDWHENAMRQIETHAEYFLIAHSSLLFEFSWAVRGFENVLMDFVSEPDFYHELLEKISEMLQGILDRLLILPIHAVMFLDDFSDQRGVMMGRQRWRGFIRPHLKEIIDRIHAAGKLVILHCCGNVTDIIPDLIEDGLDVLESVQPEAMDPYALKRNYGADLTFWGGLGTQQLMPFGKPEKIRGEVRRLCDAMGRNGGYILGPAKPLLPETPAENAIALIESCLGQMGVDFPPAHSARDSREAGFFRS